VKTVIDYSLRLTVICVVAAGLLAGVYRITAGRIAENTDQERMAAVTGLLPPVDTVTAKERGGLRVFEGFADGACIGRVVEVSENGYGGPIRLLVSIEPGGAVRGVRVLTHTETPGLGDAIAEPWFMKQFAGLRRAAVGLTKDDPNGAVDAIAAATISSRAMVAAVRRALDAGGEER